MLHTASLLVKLKNILAKPHQCSVFTLATVAFERLRITRQKIGLFFLNVSIIKRVMEANALFLLFCFNLTEVIISRISTSE